MPDSQSANREGHDTAQTLSNAQVDEALHRMRGWKREEGGLRKRYRHATFPDAIAFVNQVACLAEEAQHHPDIDIRWRNVILFLTSHELGGISERDLDLARRIDEAREATSRAQN
jgi:4a-hydroxytetrahydrobiopterin dehydratase